MRVCLYEDAGHATLEPLSATRPVFDLLCGLTSLRAKQIRHFSPCDLGVLIRPGLADLYRTLHPALAINNLEWLRAESTLLVNGRWLPPCRTPEHLPEACVGMIGGEVAFAVVPTEHLAKVTLESLPTHLNRWIDLLPRVVAEGELIAYPWQLVDRNAIQITRDFEQLPARFAPPPDHAGLHVVGPRERLWIDATARLDPLVVIDTTAGPVVIESGAVIHAFTRLEGPCFIGADTHVLGAKIRAGTTLGPGCRIGGEVECSIVQGRSNKYHDGFLGHAYLGEWVNLGAGTHNSDLRNDYGEVNVVVAGKLTPTGLTKVGCFLGDHVKSGLGTLLNTGTSIGAFCNVLPSGGFAPKYLPPFTTWTHGCLLDISNWMDSLATAHKVMGRRGASMTPAHADCYQQIWRHTAAERRRALRDHEQRRLRRSA